MKNRHNDFLYNLIQGDRILYDGKKMIVTDNRRIYNEQNGSIW